MGVIDDVLFRITEDEDVPTNIFTIEDTDPMVLLGKINEVLKALEDIRDSKQDTLTQEQLDAVNSGIDSIKVALIQTNANDIATLKGIKYGASLTASIDSSNFILSFTLKDQDGNTLGTAQTIDLPLESLVIDGHYDGVNKQIVLELVSGSVINIPVGDLISGLQPTIDSSHKLSADLVDDDDTTNKFTNDSEKATWNAKQDAGEAVLFTEVQTLTEAQKTQARQNIGAGSSGFSGDYDDLTSRPTLDTTPTTPQTTSANETITGNIKLHKISKTGTLADAIEDSTHRLVTDTEKSTWNAKQDALSTAQQNAVNSGITSNTLTTIIQTLSEHTSSLDNKANKDASNLSSANITSWANTCKFKRYDIIYDMSSSDSTLNWGYTSGLRGWIYNRDFSKYSQLKLYYVCKTGSQFDSWGSNNVIEIDLTHFRNWYFTATNKLRYLADSQNYDGSVMFYVGQNKDSICALFMDGTNSVTGYIYKIEGVY